jgi:hypothetical protein
MFLECDEVVVPEELWQRAINGNMTRCVSCASRSTV